MNQKTVGLTLRATILALALILVAGPALPPLDGVAYAQAAAPTLTVNLTPDDSVSVSWTEVDGADSYELYKQEQGGSWSSAMSMSGTTYTDDDVTAGTTYWYIVRAITDGNAGAWSNSQNVTIPGGITKPTTRPTLTAEADGSTAIKLEWTAVSDADHYDLWRWKGTWVSSVGGELTGTSYTDTGLESGATYWYIIRAVNDAGNGPWSAADSTEYESVTLEATTEEPVLELEHTSRETVKLSWSTVSDDAEYDLERFTDVSGGAVSDVDWARLPGALLSVTEYTDDTAVYVDNSTTTSYHYRVRAVIDGTEGPWSNEVSVPIPETANIPAAPELRVTSADLRSITVEWDPVDDATSYELSFKVEDGAFSDPVKVTSPYRHSRLTSGTKYTYKVRSHNVNGYSDYSDEVSGETAVQEQSGEGTVSVPSNLRVANATDGDQDKTPVDKRVGLKLTWSAVSGATGYKIMVWVNELSDGSTPNQWRFVWQDAAANVTDANGAIETLGGKSTNITFRGRIGVASAAGTALDTAGYLELKADTPYYFVILAEKDKNDSLDTSNWSTPVQGMAKALKPDPPTDLKATPTGSTSVWLSWKAPADDGTKNPSGYTISYSSVAGSGTINVKGTVYAHTDLRPDTEYRYRVRSTNSNTAPSAWEPSQTSQPTQVRAKTAPRDLEKPTGLRAVDATDLNNTPTDFTDDIPAIKVSWDKVDGAKEYEVQRWDAVKSEWSTIGTTNKTSHTDKHDVPTGHVVTVSTSYHYLVRATAGEITSPWSTSVKGLTRGASATDYMPVLTLIPTGQTLIRLTWTRVSGATGYELEYQDGDRDSAFFDDDRNDRLSLELDGSPRYYVHSGRDPGTRYSYRMRAILPHTKSDWSTVKQVVTRPATPELSATADDTDAEVELTWDVVNFDGTDLEAGTDYEIEYRQSMPTQEDWDDIDETTISCSNDECSITVGGTTSLDREAKYFFRIRVSRHGSDTTADPPAPYDPDGTGSLTNQTPPGVRSYWDTAPSVTIAAAL